MRIDKAFAEVLVKNLQAYAEGRLEVNTSEGYQPADLGFKDLLKLQVAGRYRIVEKQKAEKPKKAQNASKPDRPQRKLGTSQNRQRQVRGKTN